MGHTAHSDQSKDSRLLAEQKRRRGPQVEIMGSTAAIEKALSRAGKIANQGAAVTTLTKALTARIDAAFPPAVREQISRDTAKITTPLIADSAAIHRVLKPVQEAARQAFPPGLM
jgi:hypothetical protein